MCIIIIVDKSKNYIIGNSIDNKNVLKLKFGSASTNLWNLESSDGYVKLCKNDKNKFAINVNLDNIKLLRQTIVGYPEIAYGINLISKPFGNQANFLKFPIKADKIIDEKLYVNISYKILSKVPENLPMNISIDLWLENNPVEGNKPDNKDLEIMIWLYRYTQKPIGNLINETKYDDIDSSNNIDRWEVWSGNGNIWKTISYVACYKNEINENSINLPLYKFIDNSKSIFEFNLSEYNQMGIELGCEFGNNNFKSSKIEIEIDKFSISTDNKTIEII